MRRARQVPTEPAHHTWDAGHEPVLTIASGDTIVVETREVTDDQITPASTAADLAAVDPSRLYPLSGPVRVEGARPGDTLAVEVLEIEVAGWGWTGILPGEGLLPDDFPDPYLRIFDLIDGRETRLRDDVAIPLDPFLGVMGACPAAARGLSVMPPGGFGGNLDVRHLTRGSTLYLPVGLEGALFSCGDAHAAQGDGEVCVTAIETCARATLRLTVERDRPLAAPRFQTPPRAVDAGPRFGATGVGPDLFTAAQDAVRSMIDHLVRTYALSPEDAYVLCSLAVDLTISEVVDAGIYVVSALLPLAVFGKSPTT